MMKRWAALIALGLAACATDPAAQPATVAPDRDAHPLGFMFGEWRGTAKGIGPDRQPYELTQTERVGPMLDGDLVVVEGRGTDADGALAFNAFGIVSAKEGGGYEFRAYNDGRSGTYRFERREDGFTWWVPAGPGAEVRYEATLTDTTWVEVGTFVAGGQDRAEVFRMELDRIGDSTWPSAGVVAPQ